LSNFPELLKPSEVTERDEKIESLKQELAENTRYYVARLNEAGATIGTFKDKLEAVQAKKQRLQNDLGNSQAEVIELRSQLETERTDREEIEAELSPAKAKSCSGRHTFGEINTRRGHDSQPAPSKAQKIPGVTCRYRGNFRDD